MRTPGPSLLKKNKPDVKISRLSLPNIWKSGLVATCDSTFACSQDGTGGLVGGAKSSRKFA